MAPRVKPGAIPLASFVLFNGKANPRNGGCTPSPLRGEGTGCLTDGPSRQCGGRPRRHGRTAPFAPLWSAPLK